MVQGLTGTKSLSVGVAGSASTSSTISIATASPNADSEHSLAHAELYLTLHALVTRLDLELFETTYEDVCMAHGFFTASSRLDSEGVRFSVTASK